MARIKHINDPRGLIFDAYQMDGITVGECRSIFLDWVLGIPAEKDMREHVVSMLTAHSHGAPKHPMTTVLRDALTKADTPRRRGGRNRTAEG